MLLPSVPVLSSARGPRLPPALLRRSLTIWLSVCPAHAKSDLHGGLC